MPCSERASERDNFSTCSFLFLALRICCSVINTRARNKVSQVQKVPQELRSEKKRSPREQLVDKVKEESQTSATSIKRDAFRILLYTYTYTIVCM